MALIIFPNVTGKYVLHLTLHVRMYPFYVHFKTYMAGITSVYFHQNNGCIGFIILQHMKRLRVQVSIPFLAIDIALVRLSMTGGGLLEIPLEKVDEKKKTVLYQFFWVNISEKTII